MGFFSRKKEEAEQVELPQGGNELYTDRRFNTYWLLGLSPFEDYTIEQMHAAMDVEIKKLKRVLRTQPIDMVRIKTEKKLNKLQDIYNKQDIIEKERDDAILMFNEDMLRYNNELSTDRAKIDSAITRSGWRGDGQNPLSVEGLPQCAHCGYINRRVKKCIHCDKKL
jgi:hypothetical protein